MPFLFIYGGISATPGTGAGTLRSITGSAAGFVGTGVGAGVLQSITGSAAGAVAVTGTASGSLRSITGDGEASSLFVRGLGKQFVVYT